MTIPGFPWLLCRVTLAAVTLLGIGMPRAEAAEPIRHRDHLLHAQPAPHAIEPALYDHHRRYPPGQYRGGYRYPLGFPYYTYAPRSPFRYSLDRFEGYGVDEYPDSQSGPVFPYLPQTDPLGDAVVAPLPDLIPWNHALIGPENFEPFAGPLYAAPLYPLVYGPPPLGGFTRYGYWPGNWSSYAWPTPALFPSLYFNAPLVVPPPAAAIETLPRAAPVPGSRIYGSYLDAQFGQ